MRHCILVVLLIVSTVASAQQQHPWETYLDQLTTAEDVESTASSDWFDLLCELEEHPIDINTATREDLERIPFLTSQQVEDLQAYVYQYHGMRSVGELSLIESLDPTRQHILPYFISFSHSDAEQTFPSFRDIIRHGKHELLASAKIPFYDRKGDENGYLGYKYRHSIRYDFHFGSYVRAGIQGAQDAGEPFFANRNETGYDYYTYYIVLRKLGRLKALALGQYKLRFGMGLVLNNDFGFGKQATLGNLGRNGNSIRAHSSRSQANYMQGAAATVSLTRQIDLTAFFSSRHIDATLNNEDGSIRTILTTGYHRTESEMERKNNATQTAMGGNVRWTSGGFHVGLSGLYTRLNRELKPNTAQRYRRYDPSGRDFWNASVDYGYICHRFTFNGETATGDSHAFATINSLSFNASRTLSLMALQRFYSYKYYSLFSSSFSDGGKVQNESGIYVGANWQPGNHLTVMAYTDYAYFAAPKYQVSASSHSWDNMISAVYDNDRLAIAARYRIRTRQKDRSGDATAILTNDITQRFRLSVTLRSRQWNAKTQFDMTHNRHEATSFGWMASENIEWTPVRTVRLVANIGYFDTKDYDSRIYTYERSLLYSFSFPAYFGRGIRYAVFARADIGRRLMLIAKCGTTDYFDRDHISSGLQQIDRSSMTDLELQLRWKI